MMQLATNRDHPVTGDGAIRSKLDLIQGERFSRRELDRFIEQLDSVYNDREPEAVAALAQKLLRESLRLDEVRADAVQSILSVICERGLYVEPLATAGGRIDGIEPAETFEAFLERNQIEAALERKAQLHDHGTNQHTVGSDNCKVQSYGNSGDYLEARLRRDAPQHAAALARGEYRSARAAAIAAGIINPSAQLVLTKDPLASAQRVIEQRDPDWIAEFIAALAPELIDPKLPAPMLRQALVRLLGDRLPYMIESLCRDNPQLALALSSDDTEQPAPSQTTATVIPVSEPIEGVMSQTEAARELGVSKMTVHSKVKTANGAHGAELIFSRVNPPYRVFIHNDGTTKSPKVRLEAV